MKINHKNGSTHYYDARMMQVLNIELFINYLHRHYENYNIVEIGTAFGGLTNLLADYFDVVHSFDLEEFYTSFYEHTNIKFKKMDCHDKSLIKTEIINFLNTNKNTLFFIDGGDKALEFNIIQEYCKLGDILMVHDFSIDENDFIQRGKQIWNCLEVKEKDLNLINFKRTNFFDFSTSFAWGSYIKVK